jgi:hypothetical protein
LPVSVAAVESLVSVLVALQAAVALPEPTRMKMRKNPRRIQVL